MKRQIYSILGDFYHRHDLVLNSLQEAIKGFGEEVELCDIGTEQLSYILNESPGIVILDCENRINPQDEIINNWMTPEIEKAIVKYVSEGGSFLAWHAGLASYNETGDFIKMLKGCFKHHPSENKPVRYYTKESGISPEGLYLNFGVMDEHYFVECDEKNTEVFLWSESPDGKSIAGWRHGFGEGKVCCITPSHREEGLLHPDMIKLLRCVINWCRN